MKYCLTEQTRLLSETDLLEERYIKGWPFLIGGTGTHAYSVAWKDGGCEASYRELYQEPPSIAI